MKYKKLLKNIVDKLKLKHYTVNMKRIYIPAVAIVLISTIYAGTMFALGSTQQVKADFDHSNCQYPNRETNPVDGCDNSDPACPETIKYGYDCQPQTVEPTPAPVTAEPTPTPVVTPKTNTCGE